MRIAPLAAAAALAALTACEERTVTTNPDVMNDEIDAAAETNRPVYMPVEVGNGIYDDNAATGTGNDLDQGLDNTTIYAPPPEQQPQQ